MFSSWTFREEMNLSRSYITDMMQKVSLIDIWPTNLVLLDVNPNCPGGHLHMIKCCLPCPGIEPPVSQLPVARHTPRPMRHLICSAIYLPRVRGMFRLDFPAGLILPAAPCYELGFNVVCPVRELNRGPYNYRSHVIPQDQQGIITA